MNAREVLHKAPNWVIAICVTLFMIACVVAFVVLSVTGSSADDFSRFLNTGLNLLAIFIGGGAWITASSANDAAHRVKDHMENGNGGDIDAK